MSVDRKLDHIVQTQKELREQQQQLLELRSGSGNGGGGGSGLEQRVDRIEGRVDKAIDDLSVVKSQLSTLTERVAHLPSKGFIVQSLLATLAAIAALIAFGEKLQAIIA